MSDKFVRLKGTRDYVISIHGDLFRVIDGTPYLVTPIYSEEYPYWSVEVDGGWRRLYCHREMAIHFLPNPNNYPVVHHKDDNKRNFSIDNLEWTTQSDNVKKAYAHNLHGKVTPYEVVMKIKHFIQQGFNMKDIANWTGVNYQTVYDIKAGRRHA